ncbi:MAG: hypothetical protein KJ911_08110 [Alphaproteobacteria bacterium]|jgi:hypothetical protein|uniref:Uncharacterized protein n=1 Tax=Brevundimonas mediterranea TaxID=74329 RepID=A0A7Z8Y2W1_9CAUL|nr:MULTISPECIES: hypothetical protein [Brevundimonas]MBU4196696.1 hypothetical protein [Alphaproteobacteria bacterium]MCG2663500.1 hypothetical protein [Brevundimonas sp.]VDC49927.1 hypothetical protein BREV_BREV_01576 [Brevundimonas mediterranea]
MIFDFLWRLRGTVSVAPTTANEAVLAEVERLLIRQGMFIARRGPENLSFTAPGAGLIGRNWRAMIMLDRGRFWISQSAKGRRLHYNLRSFNAMMFCLLGALMFLAVGAAAEGIARGLAFAALAFCWLYGMNMLLAVIRVSIAIRLAVRKARRRS